MATLNFNYSEYNPKFTFKAKDPLSALSHFIGFLCSIVLSPVLLIHLSNKGASHIEMISLGIFMLSMILLYGASASYHSFNISEKANRVLKKLDHMSIFILIAGSYTPLCVMTLPKPIGIHLLIIVWTIALLGMLFKFFWVTCPKWISSVMYIAMGWACIFRIPQLYAGLGVHGFMWLLAGGLFYTIGGVIYSMRLNIIPKNNKGFGNHELFHLFVLAGSLCHYIVMFCFL